MFVCARVCVLSGDTVRVRLEGVHFESRHITAFFVGFCFVVFSSSVGECWDIIYKMATQVCFQILFDTYDENLPITFNKMYPLYLKIVA